MGTLRDDRSAPSEHYLQRYVLVFSAYECSPQGDSQARLCWDTVREHAHASTPTWLVTASNEDPYLGLASQPPETAEVERLVWDLPASLGILKRNALGRWLYRRLWHWRVESAIRDWQSRLGIGVIHRRLEHSKRAQRQTAETATARGVRASEARCALTQPRAARVPPREAPRSARPEQQTSSCASNDGVYATRTY